MQSKDFTFLSSKDLDSPFSVKIIRILGIESTFLKLTVYLVRHGAIHTAIQQQIRSPYTNIYLEFPLNISDLLLEDTLKFNLSQAENEEIFAGELLIFNASLMMQEGIVKVFMEGPCVELQFSKNQFPIVFNENDIYPKFFAVNQLVQDEDMFMENLVESKTRRLARSHLNGPIEKNMKPDASTRDLLHNIIMYPSTKELRSSEKDLVWKFRYFLSKDKKSLTKFLKCVSWTDYQEKKQAIELLRNWVHVEVEDTIELLGPQFQDKIPRKFAVAQLYLADDNHILLYLLQLVQAFKFESELYTKIDDSPLVALLLERSCTNNQIKNDFYWFLVLECESKRFGKMYAKIVNLLKTRLMESSGQKSRNMFDKQKELVSKLTKISFLLKEMRETRSVKTRKLQEYISDPGNSLTSFSPLILPIDPSIEVTGLIAEKCSVFNSALSPLKLTMTCLNGSEYELIFKNGDDLRQDQLVIQMITLMNKILLQENLDLKLTAYRVLATGSLEGMIQFIPSIPLADILKQYGSIENYFKENQSDITTYIKSSAGYCVITYLLGIGDRHLDNLMLTPTGHLFHIDFSFMLGRDPKPFPPPMKLCKEMVDVMGGTDGLLFAQFKSYCFIAFITLRKSANLIMNLFLLMLKADIPDIQIEPDKAVLKIQEKFRLDLSEEDAMKFFETLINDSVRALFPQVMEKIHSWAQYWRS